MSEVGYAVRLKGSYVYGSQVVGIERWVVTDSLLDGGVLKRAKSEATSLAERCGGEVVEVTVTARETNPMTYEVIVDGEVVWSGPDYAKALDVENEEWLGGGEPTLRRSDGKVRTVDGGWVSEGEVT